MHAGCLRYKLSQLFSDDLLQLNTILAAAACPKFIYGTVPSLTSNERKPNRKQVHIHVEAGE